MLNSSLRPILDIEVPNLATAAWKEVVRRALARASEITDQRMNVPEINADWQRLHRYEYGHFYSAWVGVAFRFRACTLHYHDFMEIFQRTGGTSQNLDLYQEDDTLFGFFVKGLSALESFYYGLYALGALIITPTKTPSVPPPDQYPWLDPSESKKLKKIVPEGVRDTFKKNFPELPLTVYLERLIDDPHYKDWRDMRNILAHRAATAGRTIQYRGPSLFQTDEPPLSITVWASDLPLDAAIQASQYDWLRETINNGLEVASAFTGQQLAYTEDQLAQFV
jgi:hypothetical protein